MADYRKVKYILASLTTGRIICLVLQTEQKLPRDSLVFQKISEAYITKPTSLITTYINMALHEACVHNVAKDMYHLRKYFKKAFIRYKH